jgi:drug/metabolite transporter (DMT)-like permease
VSVKGQTALLGNVFLFVSVLFDVIATVIAKPVLNKVSTYQATFLFIFPGVVPLALASLTQLKGWSIHDITSGGYFALLYGIVGMLLANLFFIYGLRYKKAHSIGLYQYLQSISIVIASWFILAERPSLKFIVGAVLVAVGFYWSEIRTPKKIFLYRLNKSK